MSVLKNIVQNSLELRNVDPKIIESVDTLLARAILRLQKFGFLQPRTLEFTCVDRKQEDPTLGYNYFFLPEDFGKLEEFRPVETYPYIEVSDKYKLTQQINDGRKYFTITDNNFDETSPYEKVLIAKPFPEDDEKIQIRYYVNGKGVDYEWVDETQWEAVIMEVEQILGLRSQEEADEHISRAISHKKEAQGNLVRNGLKTLNGSYFGRPKRTGRTLTRTTFRNI